jgi:poly(3-hydroxybutyrate) depolymerase
MLGHSVAAVGPARTGLGVGAGATPSVQVLLVPSTVQVQLALQITLHGSSGNEQLVKVKTAPGVVAAQTELS